MVFSVRCRKRKTCRNENVDRKHPKETEKVTRMYTQLIGSVVFGYRLNCMSYRKMCRQRRRRIRTVEEDGRTCWVDGQSRVEEE